MMIRHNFALPALTALGMATVAVNGFAQDRGRTDGPEGSEYGKGGYQRIGGVSGHLSLQVDGGGAVEGEGNPTSYSANGRPLFLGGTVSYWYSDWFLVDLSGGYVFTSKKSDALVGPRFRLPLNLLGFSLGLKAGALFIPSLGTRFGLAPNVAADVLIGDHLLLALNYAPNFAIGTNDVTHLFYLSLGWRF